MTRYQLIEHTGDIGIQVFGTSLERLFENAGFALFDIMTDIQKIQPVVNYEIEVTGNDIEELLVNWLSELNFIFQTQYILFREFKVLEMNEKNLKAIVIGEIRDPVKHPVRMEIKAVTFHQLKIEETNDGWHGWVIFDI
ncbi:archease [candidate division KSB1 bacterium]|nr:archease [candidate division KSB1 bacterium]